jgi:hypothetical protein
MGWTDLAQGTGQWRAVVNMMNLWIPFFLIPFHLQSVLINLANYVKVSKFLSCYTTSGFSRRTQLHEATYLADSLLTMLQVGQLKDADQFPIGATNSSLLHISTPALGPIQPHIQWVLQAVSQGINWWH